MITLRRCEDRGRVQNSWLDSRHTFSFGEYYDPEHMGYRALRVINEDWVQPEQGFHTHSHRDMEIITYILEGTLEHKDSLGTGSQIVPGDVQRMTAGTGVQHSEFNPSATESVHLLQIWIKPHTQGLPPSYEQKRFDLSKPGLVPLASPDGREGSVTINQDALLFGAKIASGDSIAYTLPINRHAWLHVARGQVEVGGVSLSSGDAAAISEEAALEIRASEASEILLFDLG